VGLLIDSTVLIHAERRRQSPEQLIGDLLDRFGDVELALSVMSAGELFHGCHRAEDDARGARRVEFVESILAVVPAVPITLEVMRVFGRVDATLRVAGERLATSDLLIASTALARGDEVATANVRHFDRVPGLCVRRVEA